MPTRRAAFDNRMTWVSPRCIIWLRLADRSAVESFARFVAAHDVPMVIRLRQIAWKHTRLKVWRIWRYQKNKSYTYIFKIKSRLSIDNERHGQETV